MIDFQTANEIFNVMGVSPNEHGSLHTRLLGRFLIQDGKVRILEDHNGMLHRTLHNGPVSRNLAQLKALANSDYIRVVADSEVVEGKEILPQGNPNPVGPQPDAPPSNVALPDNTPAPDQMVVAPADPTFTMNTPPAVFDYYRPGMLGPQLLEVKGDEVFMNGHKLTKPQVDRILYTVHSGLAKLKYRKAI